MSRGAVHRGNADGVQSGEAFETAGHLSGD